MNTVNFAHRYATLPERPNAEMMGGIATKGFWRFGRR